MNAEALNYLGYLLAVRGEQLDEAIQLVQRALKEEPDNGAYLDSLGWAYFRRGNLDEAEKYLVAAVKQIPDNSEIQEHLEDLFARRGRYADAVAAWTRALNGDGQDIDKGAIEKKISNAKANAKCKMTMQNESACQVAFVSVAFCILRFAFLRRATARVWCEASPASRLTPVHRFPITAEFMQRSRIVPRARTLTTELGLRGRAALVVSADA